MSEASNDYRNEPDLPPLVRRAVELADRRGFRRSCIPAVGRLLRTLAAACPAVGRIGETGTGAGVGAAWLASGKPTGALLFTAEIDPHLAAAAAGLFADHDDVRVLAADWRALVPHGPYDLLFVELGNREDQHLVVDMLAPGGVIVMHDFTPESHWPRGRVSGACRAGAMMCASTGCATRGRWRPKS